MRYFFSFYFAIQISVACGQKSADVYKIYSTTDKKEIGIERIVQSLEQADVLFFGEEHDDSVAHVLELKILEALHAKYGKQVALSMEMFDRDVQPVMNEYLMGIIKEKHFQKDARVWNNYKDYKPLVEFAKAKGLDVVCANAASRYSNLAGREGMEGLMKLPKASRSFFAPLPYALASGPYRDKLNGLMQHGDTAPANAPALKTGFDLISAQSLWDATMAYSIHEYLKSHKGQKVYQINGRFHSDEFFAIVTQLKNYNPKLRSVVISSGSDENWPNIKWDDYIGNGDFIIVTNPALKKNEE
jgi:uncharacterized iron-regulated protein